MNDEELRHNYLRRTEKERRERGNKGNHPLGGMAHVFYEGSLILLLGTVKTVKDRRKRWAGSWSRS